MGGIVVWYSKRRPADRSLTWGEAMVAAVFVFFGLLWVYGVVPHQWLTWEQNVLGWRTDALLTGPASTGALKKFPITISKSTVGDVIVTLIYGFYIACQVALWAMWQARGKKQAEEVPTSTYGRPLVKAS
jgi:hypothetical protein